eukprot:2415768-Rhodomonas_salina.1
MDAQVDPKSVPGTTRFAGNALDLEEQISRKQPALYCENWRRSAARHHARLWCYRLIGYGGMEKHGSSSCRMLRSRSYGRVPAKRPSRGHGGTMMAARASKDRNQGRELLVAVQRFPGPK